MPTEFTAPPAPPAEPPPPSAPVALRLELLGRSVVLTPGERRLLAPTSSVDLELGLVALCDGAGMLCHDGETWILEQLVAGADSGLVVGVRTVLDRPTTIPLGAGLPELVVRPVAGP